MKNIENQSAAGRARAVSHPISARKVAANRENAGKSTGPRTERGLAKSKFNAVKHGLYCQRVLVRGGTIREDGEEFGALAKAFREQLQPEGPVEAMLVEEIITTHWRLRRVLGAEAAEIRLSVDWGEEAEVSGKANPYTYGDDYLDMKGTKEGLQEVKALLNEGRERLLRGDSLSDVHDWTCERLPGGVNCLTQRLRHIWAECDGSRTFKMSDAEKATAEARGRKAMLQFLEAELADVAARETGVSEWGERELTRQAAAVLPSREVVDRIMAYEGKLGRKLYRALAQLERLQRVRNGEAVPAPLCFV